VTPIAATLKRPSSKQTNFSPDPRTPRSSKTAASRLQIKSEELMQTDLTFVFIYFNQGLNILSMLDIPDDKSQAPLTGDSTCQILM
jgi:hypothetical protein